MAINLRPHVDCNDETMEQWNPQQIIAWAAKTFGSGLAMSSSFQQQSLALLHMVSRVAPELPIYFVDTGYHFFETLQFKQQVAESQLTLALITLIRMTVGNLVRHEVTRQWKIHAVSFERVEGHQLRVIRR